MNIGDFLDQNLVMVFLLVIENCRMFKNWVIKPPYDISESSEGKKKKKKSYFIISVGNGYN